MRSFLAPIKLCAIVAALTVVVAASAAHATPDSAPVQIGTFTKRGGVVSPSHTTHRRHVSENEESEHIRSQPVAAPAASDEDEFVAARKTKRSEKLFRPAGPGSARVQRSDDDDDDDEYGRREVARDGSAQLEQRYDVDPATHPLP